MGTPKFFLYFSVDTGTVYFDPDCCYVPMKYRLILCLVLLVWGCQTQETADTLPEAPAQEEPAEAPSLEVPSDALDFSALEEVACDRI